MSKYDDIKAKFAEIWEKLSSPEKQKLLNNVKTKFSKFMCRYKELPAQEKQKLSERLKNGFSDIKDDLFLDKRRLVAMTFAFICMGVSAGAIADFFVTTGNEIFCAEPLMDEVEFSSDFRSYQRDIIVPLRKEVEAGNLSGDEFADIVSGLSDREGILNYIENSDNEDWKQRSEKVLTEDEYLNRLIIDGKITLAGFSGGFASALIWRVIDEADGYPKAKKPKREDEDEDSL